MNIKYNLAFAISTAVLLSACGGSGADDPAIPAVSNTYLLKGTVPGTMIEAYCDNGATYSTTSDQNGTSQHPFSLPLPKRLPCRVVMITNEHDPANKVVTPIKFIDKRGNSSIVITSDSGDIDLGYVDLSLTRSGMSADDNADGVEDYPKTVKVESSYIKIIEKNSDPMDRDNDGIINPYEDDDGDGAPNRYDDDDDNDGVLDVYDNDHDNDGVSDDDHDGDGIKNSHDVDDDNDGIPDYRDDDDDNDGIRDEDDDDDDNDGIHDRDDDNDRYDDDDDYYNDGYSGNDDNRLIVRSAKLFTLPLQYSADSTGGRLTTSQCAQCHGTNGYSVSSIDGLAEELYELQEEMDEMRRKSNYEIMNAQAKGYSSQEVRSIYAYLSTVVSNYGRGDEYDDDWDDDWDDD